MKLEPALLKAYEGTYEANPNFSFTIRAEGDRLIAQATRQPPLELFPEAEGPLLLPRRGRTDGLHPRCVGKIVGAVMHQNGRDQKAVRK